MTLRRGLPYVVLVVVLVVSGVVLWRELRDDRPHAKVGEQIAAADRIPVGKTWTVLVPGVRLDVGATDLLDDVPDDLAAQRKQRPDDGSFIGIDVRRSAAPAPPLPYFRSSSSVPVVRLAVVADGVRYPLRTSPYAEDDAADVPLATYVALGGRHDAIRLAATWDGRTQSIDLRTGDREAGSFADLYRPAPAALASCGTPRWTSGFGPDPRGSGGAACRYSAVRRSWVGGPGWAPAGRSWLVVTALTTQPSDVVRRSRGTERAYYNESNFSTDLRQRLDGAAPVATTVPPGYSVDSTRQSAGLVLFAVPTAASGQTLTFVQQTELHPRRDLATDTVADYDVSISQTWTVRLT